MFSTRLDTMESYIPAAKTTIIQLPAKPITEMTVKLSGVEHGILLLRPVHIGLASILKS